jgi:glucose-1-phosphate thymidylyltransferase
MKRKGIVLAGGSGTRLYPLTFAVSKQLMPIYDKPMIYYPISVLMLAGIRELLIISTSQDQPDFQRLLGDGSFLGLEITYAVQPKPEGIAQALLIGAEFIGSTSCALVLGDNLFYGHDFVKALQVANACTEGAVIFGYHVVNPSAYGVVEFAANGQVIGIEEKPVRPKSNYVVPGLYFYDDQVVSLAGQLKPSARGEIEITDLNRCYLKQGKLRVDLLGRGTAWLDTGTPGALLDAAQFVQIVEARQGLKIACLEEIAYRQQWINRSEIETQIARHASSAYANYLRGLIDGK